MPIDHVNALPSGTRFEEYRLDAVLGAGGFGITYRAYDANLDKFVAIKEYLPVEFATRTEASTVVPHSNADAQDYHWGLTRFLDEARTLARFDHPHLNKVHRFFESNGTAYMVLEYVQGETLADRLSKEPYLEEEPLQRLLEEVLSGLSVMHDAGYVHRDIKPGNLMLREEDGSAVVLDFGAARQAVGQRSKAITSILTPGYAPIEQYDSKADDVGPWSDIYALGIVAYRCVSGISDSELPDAVTRGRTQRKGGEDLTPAVEAGKGKYNAKLLEGIDWAIEVDEDDRPQTVGECQRALAGSGHRKGLAKSVRRTVTRSANGGATTERTGINWSGVALTVVILALVGVSVWMASQLYPERFKLASDDSSPMAQQEIPTDMSGDTPHETEPGETGEELASDEQAPLQRDTSQTASAKSAAESDVTITQQPTMAPVKTPPAEEDEVTRLLAAAEADLKARRLTSPAGNNAWDRYQRVLELEPTNLDAIKGMERVIEGYMELFGTAVEQEDFEQADSYLGRIRDLHPDSPVLITGRQQLEDAKHARENRLAQMERQRQAEEAARQAKLQNQRIAQAIKQYWIAFETALQAEDMAEATSILAEVRELNPEEPELAYRVQQLAELQRRYAIKEHVAMFETAMSEEDLDEAGNQLDHVRGLDPDASGLPEMAQLLEAVQARYQAIAMITSEIAGQMVSIPGGTFRMGSSGFFAETDEKPAHSVTVPDFKVGKYEVTFSQWDACVADGGCGGYRPDDGGWGRGNRPVINVSWDDAQLFIDWLNDKTGGNFRLPTESEWEYAARAGSTTKYHFGDAESQLCQYANHADSSYTDHNYRNKACSDGIDKRTAEVGQYQPNAWGLYDMHGNVGEWVEDCWNYGYDSAPTDGSAWTSGDCNVRAIRGGTWRSAPSLLRSSSRWNLNTRPDRDDNDGFRLAQYK